MERLIIIPLIAILTLCSGWDVEELGGGYILYNNAIYFNIQDTQIIQEAVGSDVIDVNYDDYYIVAKRKQEDWIVETVVSDPLSDVSLDKVKRFNQKDMMTDESFWIIIKASQQVYGPLTHASFQQMCDSLHVQLKLNQ